MPLGRWREIRWLKRYHHLGDRRSRPRTPRALAQSTLPLDRIKLPPGFVIEVVAHGRRAPARWRSGAQGHAVRRLERGNVYAITLPRPGAARPPGCARSRPACAIPAGVAFRDGALYVSAVSRILRFDDIERRLDAPPTPVVVNDACPTDGHHGRKFIAFGPDGKLYVPVGAPCNICEPDPRQFAIITRMNPDGSGLRDRRARRAQHGRLRLASADAGAVVHRQRARHAGRRRRRPTSSTASPRAGVHFGYPVLPRRHDRRPASSAQRAVQRVRRRRRRISGRTSPRSACASTPARSFRPHTATRSSSPSTARGTAARRSATA